MSRLPLSLQLAAVYMLSICHRPIRSQVHEALRLGTNDLPEAEDWKPTYGDKAVGLVTPFLHGHSDGQNIALECSLVLESWIKARGRRCHSLCSSLSYIIIRPTLSD